MQYMGLCVFSLPISFMMIVIMCALNLIIIMKSEVRPICHCLGLGHETLMELVTLDVLSVLGGGVVVGVGWLWLYTV